ncbi:hypothetical protein MLD38_037790 [Melastoma candidum]|uniref:Uncharacterized protein n=1 Tax=Melastoma candidum TaxID=119954 RepID=A0ACB9LQD9_9MYRT|nr:hypothetical protein MLD38_037790 [Melastoma candidum]
MMLLVTRPVSSEVACASGRFMRCIVQWKRSSACVLLIMDGMRRRSIEGKMGMTGEGLEWGLFGFGPGLTVEMVVLHSVAVDA